MRGEELRTADFDYELPEELIAQHPVDRRDGSRLLVADRSARALDHRSFSHLPELLQSGDLLVVNNSRVLPARLHGFREPSGGRFEILLLEAVEPEVWWTLLKPGRRVREGTSLRFVDAEGHPTPLMGTVEAKNDEGHCRIRFGGVPDLMSMVMSIGQIPLPPYIRRDPGSRSPEDLERYQTVYASQPGSVAAPTAGLHFTPELIGRLADRGVSVAALTLHVGMGTFRPVQVDKVKDHVMHGERYDLPVETVEAIRKTRARGRRVVAVGTTTLRVLEWVARQPGVDPGSLPAGAGTTRLYLHPPADIRVADALITNFHLPRSTLLMLVSAFAAPGRHGGREWMLQVYREAVQRRYRFFSYGDAMLLM